MTGTAVARGAIAQLAGLGLGIGDELGEIPGRHVRVHHIQTGHLRQQADGLEVLVGVVRQLVEDVRIDRQRADVPEDDGVLIVAARDFRHRDVACGAGLVVDEDTLAERVGKFRGGGARDDFRASAGSEGNHETHGLGRPGGLGRCQRRQEATKPQSAAGLKEPTPREVGAGQ